MDSGVRNSTYLTSSSSTASSTWGQVTPLPFVGGDEELVEALRKGHPGAAKAFYDRYADVVDRVLARILGADDDGLPALIQDAFLRAIAGVGRLRDPARLQVWVSAAAVAAARAHLRRQSRGRLVARLRGPQRATASAPAAARAGDPVSHAMYALYDVLDTMPADERIALALRVVDAMPLAEIAEVSGVSVGRLRRRLRRAEARFVAAARDVAALRPWLDRGSRWILPTLG
jgi:RNA polymerase sigma-70 factor (ECF subfamily)